ncbi:hypothetical protein PAT3040_06349 [Paenibacillus agaridevorans]|uniref:Winged helix DNA-binding domain-containing protein n=1 Tax=Paenibacillus agaridevorans TaxID=171404 RepID=A0A2R5EXT3_9BACL|nr:winged helix DNA-binding domain-containing protein [Paenibacillus agaridevorans]GBG11526.1 hypothetical protein PAT3040_06349 [Paenibacillus agaridevorans]
MSTIQLSRKSLNRTLLHRQLLLERSALSPLEAVEQLVGLQAQSPKPPYYALWSRLHNFEPSMLAELLLGRDVVRIALMRSTIHLVSARDCLSFRSVLQPVQNRLLMGTHGKALVGVDMEQLADTALKLLAESPRTFEELGKLLQEHWPSSAAGSLATAVRGRLPLVQLPPRGVWGRSGAAIHATVEEWLGMPLAEGNEHALLELIRRYLRAFGPASVKDIGVWSGLSKLGPVLEKLRPELRTYRDDAGQELFDLVGLPLLSEDTAAPVRFLSEFDNMLLSYQDRSRIMDPAHKQLVFTVNGIIKSTFLVDGFVAGLWRIESSKHAAILYLRPFGPIRDKDRGMLEEEGGLLLAFAEPKREPSIVWEAD